MISDQDKISVPPKLPPIADSLIGMTYYLSILKKINSLSKIQK